MIRAEITLLETRLSDGQVGGRVECPSNLRPAPGQYLLAHAPALDEPLPTALFPACLPAAGATTLELAAPLPEGWSAGLRLSARGPLGHGFTLPTFATHVALVPLGRTAQRLLPLAQLALAQGAAVALYARRVPPDLPAEVEVLPPEQIAESLTWANYIAFDAPLHTLSGLRRRFDLAPHTPLPVSAQVLVIAPMPCGGLADCGLCAVPTRQGWRHACKDGPVFDFNDLEEV